MRRCEDTGGGVAFLDGTGCGDAGFAGAEGTEAEDAFVMVPEMRMPGARASITPIVVSPDSEAPESRMPDAEKSWIPPVASLPGLLVGVTICLAFKGEPEPWNLFISPTVVSPD